MAHIHATLFHVCCFLIFGFGLYYDTVVVRHGWSVYAGKTRYATYWDIILQTVYFGLRVVLDLGHGWNQKKSFRDPNENTKLKCLVNWISCAMAFPLGTFVSLSFWGLYFFNREFIYPSYLDDIIPSWLNHILHTMPLVLQILDKFVVNHAYPRRLSGIFGILGLTTCYQIWMIWIAHYTRTWVYPILDYLPLFYRVIFLGSMWTCLVLLYLAGELLSRLFWRKKGKTMKLV